MIASVNGSRNVNPAEAQQLLSQHGTIKTHSIPDYPSKVWCLRASSTGVSTTTEYVHKYPTGSFVAKTLTTPRSTPGQSTETRRVITGDEARQMLSSSLAPAAWADETF